MARTDDLPFDRKRIQRLATIVSSPNIGALDQTSFNININFCNVSRERIRRCKTCCCTFVDSTHWRGAVGAAGDERTFVLLRFVQCFEVGNTNRRVVLVVNTAVVKDQIIRVVAKHLPCCFEQLLSNLKGGANGSVRIHECDTA